MNTTLLDALKKAKDSLASQVLAREPVNAEQRRFSDVQEVGLDAKACRFNRPKP